MEEFLVAAQRYTEAGLEAELLLLKVIAAEMLTERKEIIARMDVWKLAEVTAYRDMRAALLAEFKVRQGNSSC
ncbi:hypothetical protein ACFQ5J_06075 [Lacticaseibacillus baoqingensis]|uniref:Uncharacterized protein n=1 Tax=Lacticaseibacillus baoqingensis TaxID=2486013 RepID=A0ABW4E723_9LACO|nr:hypothetical protein [Lacticaseibacillus baoqingensis]